MFLYAEGLWKGCCLPYHLMIQRSVSCLPIFSIFPSSLRIPFSSFFHQIARLEFILTAEKVKWLNLFLKMGNFLMFQACLGKPGSISEILTFFILKISSHSPFKRAVCVMGGEISYSCIFHCYNRDVKAIPFLSLQSFLYPLELKFFWKKYYYAIYRCQ